MIQATAAHIFESLSRRPPTNVPYTGSTESRSPQASSVLNQAASSTEVPRAQLVEAVSKLNEYIKNSQVNLSFTIDQTTDLVVVKVIDAETKEVIRQIPSEEAVELARKLEESSAALLQTQA